LVNGLENDDPDAWCAEAGVQCGTASSGRGGSTLVGVNLQGSNASGVWLLPALSPPGCVLDALTDLDLGDDPGTAATSMGPGVQIPGATLTSLVAAAPAMVSFACAGCTLSGATANDAVCAMAGWSAIASIVWPRGGLHGRVTCSLPVRPRSRSRAAAQ